MPVSTKLSCSLIFEVLLVENIHSFGPQFSNTLETILIYNIKIINTPKSNKLYKLYLSLYIIVSFEILRFSIYLSFHRNIKNNST